MKTKTIEGLEIRILSLDAFLEVFERAEREQAKKINLQCKTTREKGSLIVYVRDDVYGPAAETFYSQLYEDLRAEGLKKQTINLVWTEILPDVLG